MIKRFIFTIISISILAMAHEGHHKEQHPPTTIEEKDSLKKMAHRGV